MKGTVPLPVPTLVPDFCFLVISPSFSALLMKPSILWILLLPHPSLTCPTRKVSPTLVQLRIVTGVNRVCRMLLSKIGFRRPASWKVVNDGSAVASVGGQVDGLLCEAGVNLVVVFHLGVDVPLRVVQPMMAGTLELLHEAGTKHRPLWSGKVGEGVGAPRQVSERVPSLLRRARGEKCRWKVVPDSWAVVHGAAVHQRPARLLVQRGELVRPEALRCLVSAGNWRLVELASIARAARDRDYLIFHISAAHASLGIIQLTIILALTAFMQSVLECHYTP